MTTLPPTNWAEANQRALVAELAVVRAALRRHAGEPADPAADAARRAELAAARAALPSMSALDHLAGVFGLSPFERAVLVLCAGIELDAAVAGECAAAQGDPHRPYPTFGLALAALPDPHWSALTPDAPLRYWRLVEPASGPGLTAAPLRIDERVLHLLAGVPGLDERLAGLVEPVPPPDELPPSHRTTAERVVARWRADVTDRPAAVLLCGPDPAGKREVAAAACTALGLGLYALPADRLPTTPSELELLGRLWDREAALAGRALIVECDDGPPDPARDRAVRSWVSRARGPLLVAARDPVPGITRPRLTVEVRKPTATEQRRLWEQRLGPTAAGLNGQLDRLTAQFDLGAAAIGAVCGGLSDPSAVWDDCRAQSRVKLDDLAQRVESRVGWDDLVLPERTLIPLRDIVVQVRQRARVYGAWGFADKSSRGLGVSALFAGPSGTGKTLAAEVLANELRLDLYRVDLSQVVSKYIGETEKNLRRVFDAAEDGGAVLLFDEADALFGKRTEVKDGHDRYANVEVGYLLQRVEAYRGLAVLTTNLKDEIDPAFLRRLRFVVPFPFPDAALRAAIWRRAFPPAAPTDGLDPARLARLGVAGGTIRNAALGAAFLAAEAGEPVRMRHLARAVRAEFAKLDKPAPEAELEGWE